MLIRAVSGDKIAYRSYAMASMRKKILVTGGAGFVGSHLCEELTRRGHHVIALDSLLTGNRSNLPDGVAFLHQDVCQPIDLDVDEIYNLACPASPIHYQQDPVLTTKTSVLGALSVLECARNNGARVLQASTSEVYGDPHVHPQPESYWGNVNPIGIRACYDEGKRCAETLFFDYARQYQTRIVVARIFNTYGPRMHIQDGRVVSNFIVQALRNEPITIFGAGTQTRSFCYVDDLVAGLICLMESTLSGPVNLGNPSEFTIRDLAEQIVEMTQSRSRLSFCPLPQDDPKQRQPDITQARACGWEPHISLRDGLQRTIAYFSKECLHV